MASTTETQISAFLSGAPHAVVGASQHRYKYGNKVLRCYQQAQRPVYAINPRGEAIENNSTYARLLDVPESVHGISVITPPRVTEQIIADAIALGIQHVWLQPGAESKLALELAEAAGLNIIAGGPCILVVLGFSSRR